MKELLNLKVSDIEPDPEQPRKDFEPEALSDLANSIKTQGLKTPISVRAHPNKRFGGPAFMIIAGERRWRAHQLAGIEHIIAIEEKEGAIDENAIFAHQLIENIQREDLNPVEKAEFIQKRIDHHKALGCTTPTEEVAAELGKSPSWVSKSIQILRYSPEIRDLAKTGKIRDYSMIKKIDQLSPKKKQQAIEQIQDGSFNGKEFFKRKRYEPAKRTREGQGEEAGEPSVSPAKPELVRLSIPNQAWLRIIEKTDYACLLDKDHPEWRQFDSAKLKTVIGTFVDWVQAT